MPTIIHSCGSHWHGEAQSSIDDLMAVLETEPLDLKFEQYGNYISPNWGRNGILDPELNEQARRDRMFGFWGNFANRSFVFNIHTNDRALIRKLGNAIRSNQRRQKTANPAF